MLCYGHKIYRYDIKVTLIMSSKVAQSYLRVRYLSLYRLIQQSYKVNSSSVIPTATTSLLCQLLMLKILNVQKITFHFCYIVCRKDRVKQTLHNIVRILVGILTMECV